MLRGSNRLQIFTHMHLFSRCRWSTLVSGVAANDSNQVTQHFSIKTLTGRLKWFIIRFQFPPEDKMPMTHSIT